jgi:hypothetical protein
MPSTESMFRACSRGLFRASGAVTVSLCTCVCLHPAICISFQIAMSVSMSVPGHGHGHEVSKGNASIISCALYHIYITRRERAVASGAVLDIV